MNNCPIFLIYISPFFRGEVMFNPHFLITDKSEKFLSILFQKMIGNKLKITILSKHLDKMIGIQEVSSFNLGEILNRIKKDPVQVLRDVQAFSKREISIAEVGIEGIGIHKLQELTDFFFPSNFIEEYVKNALKNIDSLADFLPDKFYDQHQKGKGEEKVEEGIRKIFEELNISRFSLLIHAIILEKANYALYFDEKKTFQILDIDEIDSDSKKSCFGYFPNT